MAYENDNSSAVPPPVSLPTEEEVRARIEAVAGPRYRKQRERLYTDLAELGADTRRSVLLAVLREYQMEPPARRRQRKASRRTMSEPRIKAGDYAKQHKELERLLRQIEEHPLVYHFCRAHMVRYPKKEAICRSHERWTKWCHECHSFDRPRAGRPVDGRRHRLLTTIVPRLEADGHKPEASIGVVAAVCSCFGDPVAVPTLERQWFRLKAKDKERKQKEKEQRKPLADFWNSDLPRSQVREWSPQLDLAACTCRLRFPLT